MARWREGRSSVERQGGAPGASVRERFRAGRRSRRRLRRLLESRGCRCHRVRIEWGLCCAALQGFARAPLAPHGEGRLDRRGGASLDHELVADEKDLLSVRLVVVARPKRDPGVSRRKSRHAKDQRPGPGAEIPCQADWEGVSSVERENDFHLDELGCLCLRKGPCQAHPGARLENRPGLRGDKSVGSEGRGCARQTQDQSGHRERSRRGTGRHGTRSCLFETGPASRPWGSIQQ